MNAPFLMSMVKGRCAPGPSRATSRMFESRTCMTCLVWMMIFLSLSLLMTGVAAVKMIAMTMMPKPK